MLSPERFATPLILHRRKMPPCPTLILAPLHPTQEALTRTLGMNEAPTSEVGICVPVFSEEEMEAQGGEAT